MGDDCQTPFKGKDVPPPSSFPSLEGISSALDEMNSSMLSVIDNQISSIELLDLLVIAQRQNIFNRLFDTGIQTIATAVTTDPGQADSILYTSHDVYAEMQRVAPVLYLVNLGPGTMYARVSDNGVDFSSSEYAVFEGGIIELYNVYEIRVRSPVAGTRYVVTEHKTSLGNTYSTLNRPITLDALAVVATYGEGAYVGNVLQAGGANSTISFDITGFANIAKLTQAVVTQRVAGAANFTLEIWERDTYVPATRADLYMRIWTRDYAVDEDSDIIDPITLYFDRDSSAELHVRLVNNAGGQASEFDLSFKAFINPL